MDVFVTGLGVSSALGINTQECFESLKAGTTGIQEDAILNGSKSGLYAGAVKYSDKQLKELLNISINSNIPRTALLGMVAAAEAFKNSEVHPEIRTGFINGTTTGGMDLSEEYFRSLYLKNDASGYAVIGTHDLGTVTSLIHKHLGLQGYVNTLSTACSSSSNSIMLGARMIKSGMLDRVLVGGTDALTAFTSKGFKSLMIYDQKLCTPFDENRAGLNLGEGAGYVLLESESSLTKSNGSPMATITGWANANDAHHQTGSSPEGMGASLAMQGALKQAGLGPEEIHYLNAHGTATKNNDDSEMAALETVFENIDFSSTKGLTGHTLGASGGIEAVFSILSLKNQCAYANANWQNQMTAFKTKPRTEFQSKEVKNVMSNSFGFGGNSTSLIFSAI